MQQSSTLDANKSACQLLDSVWQGRGFPIDPMWIAEELGVTVLEAELPDNVMGGLVKDADKDAVILLNQLDSQDHKRFSCAQKIGHYVDYMLHDEDCYKYVDFGAQQASFMASADEVFANYFGASLLMPEGEVRDMAGKGIPLAGMAAHFGVSEEVMKVRLTGLGVSAHAAAAV